MDKLSNPQDEIKISLTHRVIWSVVIFHHVSLEVRKRLTEVSSLLSAIVSVGYDNAQDLVLRWLQCC